MSVSGKKVCVPGNELCVKAEFISGPREITGKTRCVPGLKSPVITVEGKINVMTVYAAGRKSVSKNNESGRYITKQHYSAYSEFTAYT